MRKSFSSSSLWQKWCARRERRGASWQSRSDRFAPAETFEPRVVLSAVSVSQSGAAELHQHSQPERVARIINGTQTSDYPAVGLIGESGDHFCTGTLIAPQYVLTAAHCAEGVGNASGTFTVGGRSYQTERVFIHPNYNGNSIGSDSANDIAIYKLSQPVVGVEPMAIFTGIPQVGQLLTLVGFGGGGNGTTGTNGDFGIKRVGTTPIDQVTRTLIHWDFENNTEANTAPGDSGGPAFVTINGVKYIAGVTSGGDSPNASIGDHSFDTRVDAYADWITSIAGVTGGGGGGGGGDVLPTLSIVATDASAVETAVSQTANTGTYTISRTGSTDDALVVSLSYTGTATSGSDYSSLSTQVTIPAGQSSVTLTVRPVDDTLSESSESVIATLQSSSAYNLDSSRSGATVTIADNDRVLPAISIRASDAVAAETRTGQTANRGQYQVTRTGSTTSSLTVYYSVSGSATNGSDYSRLSGSVTIPAGRTSVTFSVNPVDDALAEGTENVVLTLASRSNYSIDAARESATVTIQDNEAANRTNDNFADRVPLTGSSVTASGNNRTATGEAGEPNPAGVSGSKSAWWTWTAPSTGQFTINTSGSSFDTTLGVYTGSSVTSLLLVAENDDANFDAGDYTSQVTINAVAGTKYQIQVNGYEGASGDITLRVNSAATTFANRPAIVRRDAGLIDSAFRSYTELAGRL